MTEPDDIVAMLYEIGGRRDTHDSRPIRRSELDGAGDTDGVIDEQRARQAYRSRIRARASQRGGAR
jgi:hypothetical protein